MVLSPTPEQDELRRTLRAFLARASPLDAVRRVVETDEGYDREVYRRFDEELGLSGMAVGGAGAGAADLAVVMEECGAALLPGPMLGSAVIAASVLDAAGDDTLLPAVASGAVIASFLDGATLDVVDGAASGAVAGVLDGMNAEVLLVADADVVYRLDPAGPGVTRSPLVTLDPTRRQAAVTLERAPVVAVGPSAGLGQALDRASVALAAEQLGVLRRSVEMAVGYAREREQFGRPIGSFQAVKHGLADLHATYELAVGVVAAAAWAADHEPENLAVPASLARAYLSPQSFEGTIQMIQYHGGIGFTWEHDAHLYYRRAKANESLLGDVDVHLERVARHLLGDDHAPAHERPAVMVATSSQT